ncbi:unnamed protein product [Amoebophrya sp. A25]|nr:unnamed protein product [Amoebophrya sp. A25]|eukprot:GSA25T00019560001.1
MADLQQDGHVEMDLAFHKEVSRRLTARLKAAGILVDSDTVNQQVSSGRRRYPSGSGGVSRRPTFASRRGRREGSLVSEGVGNEPLYEGEEETVYGDTASYLGDLHGATTEEEEGDTSLGAVIHRASQAVVESFGSLFAGPRPSFFQDDSDTATPGSGASVIDDFSQNTSKVATSPGGEPDESSHDRFSGPNNGRGGASTSGGTGLTNEATRRGSASSTTPLPAKKRNPAPKVVLLEGGSKRIDRLTQDDLWLDFSALGIKNSDSDDLMEELEENRLQRSLDNRLEREKISKLSRKTRAEADPFQMVPQNLAQMEEGMGALVSLAMRTRGTLEKQSFRQLEGFASWIRVDAPKRRYFTVSRKHGKWVLDWFLSRGHAAEAFGTYEEELTDDRGTIPFADIEKVWKGRLDYEHQMLLMWRSEGGRLRRMEVYAKCPEDADKWAHAWKIFQKAAHQEAMAQAEREDTARIVAADIQAERKRSISSTRSSTTSTMNMLKTRTSKGQLPRRASKLEGVATGVSKDDEEDEEDIGRRTIRERATISRNQALASVRESMRQAGSALIAADEEHDEALRTSACGPPRKYSTRWRATSAKMNTNDLPYFDATKHKDSVYLRGLVSSVQKYSIVVDENATWGRDSFFEDDGPND